LGGQEAEVAESVGSLAGLPTGGYNRGFCGVSLTGWSVVCLKRCNETG